MLVLLFGLDVFLMFNCFKGGMEKNVELVFKVWLIIIGLNVVEYIFNLLKVVEMMQVGDVVLFLYMFMQVELMKFKGILMEFVVFKEGVVVLLMV